MCLIVDGGWTEWNPWRQCSVSCEEGLQSRTRSCTNPSPANAGKQCVGQNFDVKLCYRGFCEGGYYNIYIKANYTCTYTIIITFYIYSIKKIGS
jgi:hypothetical protein